MIIFKKHILMIFASFRHRLFCNNFKHIFRCFHSHLLLLICVLFYFTVFFHPMQIRFFFYGLCIVSFIYIYFVLKRKHPAFSVCSSICILSGQIYSSWCMNLVEPYQCYSCLIKITEIALRCFNL